MTTSLTGKTINEVVFKAVKAILTHGERTTSRNGDVSVLYNAFLTLEHPRSRHLNLIGRKNNIFAMIAETLWVLAGKNNIDPLLTFFLPRAPQFSDDGKTWRGGYGPRWYMYDQLEDAINVFVEEGLQSRRSVISIYLPELDTKKSLKSVYGLESTKDRPCNNMVHFFVTPDKRLHMNVYQRSGDVIWGLGSINIFEWTVLQEFVLAEIRRRVDESVCLGFYNHFVTNLHLYDFTGAQGHDVVKAEEEHVFDDLNHSALAFPAGVETNRAFLCALIDVFDQAIQEKKLSFEAVTKSIRRVFAKYLESDFEKNLLYGYALVIGAYICAKNGNADITVDLRAFSREFTAAVKGSLFRKFKVKTRVEFHEKIDLLLAGVCHLQAEKDRMYDSEWKRSGMISSVFHIFRKLIRLRTLWRKGWKTAGDDVRLDTLVDLLNYLIMCETLHAELYPDAFQSFLDQTVPFSSLISEQFTSNAAGFQLFCSRLLSSNLKRSSAKRGVLEELAPQLIQLGEKAIGAWLSRLDHIASLSHKRTRKSRSNTPTQESVDTPEDDIVLFVKELYQLIKLCAAVTIVHGEQNPAEWNAFLCKNST
jgi:thymidylate synthase